MAAPASAPFGSWRSPISSELAASSAMSLSQLTVSGDDVYWLEGRPSEGGRYVIVRRSADRTIGDVTPPGLNARTRVHEYGGGSYFVSGSTVYFSNFSDQRLYRQDSGDDPIEITPDPEVDSGLRFADGVATADGRSAIAVQERHFAEGEATNEIVRLTLDGSARPQVLVSGNDFYAFPRLSHDGRKLAWTTWNHPNMPWDGCELWVADLTLEGIANARKVVGGENESIFQPEWSPSGALHFISDRTNWWNLYRLDGDDAIAIAPIEAEVGVPQWVFGFSRYAFLPDGTIACVYTKEGNDVLGLIRPGSNCIEPLDTPFTTIDYCHTTQDGKIWAIGASPTEFATIISVDPASGEVERIHRSSKLEIDPGYVSVAEPIEFPTENDTTAHALFYAPANKDFTDPTGERPPLLVFSHGGPTSATHSSLSLGIQFWTSRGMAVVDVNYGGSTGYGREYRERLKGNWGVVDVDDCVNAARYLTDRGDVDGGRLAIRGGSAGGFTTLNSVTFRDVFAAGASYYGLADLPAFVGETHKFESRYLDGLVGPFPEARDVYEERSAAFHTDLLSCPLVLFQGQEDKVVPPHQAELMVEALQRKGLPYAYITYEGEQHGFRKAENIKHSLESELYFYSRIFGFEPADEITPIKIENL
jgi:dipeptidyl aminopeptidase/acylaminoacyl peptidase